MHDHLPRERIKTINDLHSLRGQPLYLVTQDVIVMYPPGEHAVFTSSVHVQMCFAGPILIDHSQTASSVAITRHRYELFDPSHSMARGGAAYYLTENGDWGNAARKNLTMFPLEMFILDDDDSPMAGELNFNNAICTTREAADIWAVQLKLTYDAIGRPHFKGYKTTKRRGQIKNSLAPL